MESHRFLAYENTSYICKTENPDRAIDPSRMRQVFCHNDRIGARATHVLSVSAADEPACPAGKDLLDVELPRAGDGGRLRLR